MLRTSLVAERLSVILRIRENDLNAVMYYSLIHTTTVSYRIKTVPIQPTLARALVMSGNP